MAKYLPAPESTMLVYLILFGLSNFGQVDKKILTTFSNRQFRKYHNYKNIKTKS